MRKIPTLFVRDPRDMKHVLPKVTPGCEWVLAGEGVATRKYDGTCVMFDGHDWWYRREVKPGKTPPPDFDEVDYDEVTGKRVGWVSESSFEPYLLEATDGASHGTRGTFELCGPKVNGNPEGFDRHVLVRHGRDRITDIDMTPHAQALPILRDYLLARDYEGIVWHHPDGRMAKLKRKDIV